MILLDEQRQVFTNALTILLEGVLQKDVSFAKGIVDDFHIFHVCKHSWPTWQLINTKGKATLSKCWSWGLQSIRKKVCVVGGRNYIPFKSSVHPEYSFYLFDAIQYACEVVELNQKSSILLSRSNFGACVDGKSICGGIGKYDAKIEPMNKYSSIKLLIIDDDSGDHREYYLWLR